MGVQRFWERNVLTQHEWRDTVSSSSRRRRSHRSNDNHHTATILMAVMFSASMIASFIGAVQAISQVTAGDDEAVVK